jgi:sec-independent protein translocase protein TatA
VPFDVSIPEMLVLVVVVLLLFGPKRAPEMGRSLAKNIREIRDGISGLTGATSGASPTQLPPRETVDYSGRGSASPESQTSSGPVQERETIS